MKGSFASLRMTSFLSLVLLLTLLAGGYEWRLVRIVDPGAREQIRAGELYPPEFTRFVQQVRELTPPRSSISLILPVHRWNEGYAYPYFRASYELAGRRLIPVIVDGGQWDSRLDSGEYVAIWNSSEKPEGYTIVWQGHGGKLMRRPRK